MTDDHLVAALTRHLDAGGELPDLGAPYDDLLAGLASDSLLDDERAAALQLLDEHPGYRALLVTIDRGSGDQGFGDAASDTDAPARPAGRILAWPRIAAAAILLLGVGVAMFLWARPGPLKLSPDAQLVAAANELRGTDPTLFADFEPLGPEARSQRPDDTRRGGLHLHAPRGTVLEERPTFRWTRPDGASSVTLSVLNEDGEVVLEQSTDADSLVWPETEAALPAGRYVWKLVATTAARRLTATLAFARASDTLTSRYTRGVEAIRARGGGGDPALLAAHWAAHLGLWSEALRLLENAEDGPLTTETRDWLQARVGG